VLLGEARRSCRPNAAAVGNRFVSRRVRRSSTRAGGELWKAIEGTGIFTNLTIEMIKVGEASGALRKC
jgi:type II secretory pathway component PulF